VLKPILLTLLVLAVLVLAPLIGSKLSAAPTRAPLQADTGNALSLTYPPFPYPGPGGVYLSFLPALCRAAQCFTSEP
jgi:hypothetical protein